MKTLMLMLALNIVTIMTSNKLLHREFVVDKTIPTIQGEDGYEGGAYDLPKATQATKTPISNDYIDEDAAYGIATATRHQSQSRAGD